MLGNESVLLRNNMLPVVAEFIFFLDISPDLQKVYKTSYPCKLKKIWIHYNPLTIS